MADLGLSSLEDEQLISLLNEAVVELLSRDPCAQKVAQQGILGIAEKRAAFMKVVQEAVRESERAYMDAIRQDVRADIAQAIQAGEIKLGSVDLETKIIVDVTKEQIAAIKADMNRGLEESSFRVEYNGTTRELKATYHSAGQNWDAKRNLTASPTLVASVRKAVLGAFGIPED